MAEGLPVKVTWKLGNVELQYEGHESFLKNELPKIFQEFLEIYKSSLTNDGLDEQVLGSAEPSVLSPNNPSLGLSVNSIASKLKVKGGKDLALAACAYFALVENKPTFSREEIRDAMKTATHFYSENHRKTLSAYISTLMKSGQLLERSPNVYAVEGKTLRDLRDALDK